MGAACYVWIRLNGVPNGQRYSVTRAYFSFIHDVCRSPQKGALLHTYGKKHKVIFHGSPRKWKAYIQWGAAWFPKGQKLYRYCVISDETTRWQRNVILSVVSTFCPHLPSSEQIDLSYLRYVCVTCIHGIHFSKRLRILKVTLILLTWKIWWAPKNASKWQMGSNSAFKGLNHF
jgi:hypothetical protein